MAKDNVDCEKVCLSLPRDLVRRVDEFAAEAGMSRSGIIAELLEVGYKQSSLTKRLMANKYILRAFQMIFKVTPEKCDKALDMPSPDKKLIEAVRRSVLRELKKLSIDAARVEIERDMGLDSVS